MSGFTLIELLVVVSIISLLIAILMPSLRKAREQVRATVCLANVRHVVLGFRLYAEDFGVIPGTYWQGPIDLDWSGRNNATYLADPDQYDHPMETSVLRRYISSVDAIFECPTAKRDANTFFDYTVIIRMAGASPDLRWYMTYIGRPARPAGSLRRFDALPFLIEEDSVFYNQGVDDGSWANNDQITDRHNHGGNLGYLDGSAGRFISPKGSQANAEEPEDLTAHDLFLWAKGRHFDLASSNANEFGWVNDPE
ncbi:MAG: type II secretion system protein [Planctomycetes bacterium]|nr:type II secretion system protein [Planctomycetota bacterium]